MSTWRSDVMGIRIDNASGVLTSISRWTNDYDFGAAFPTLDDTGLGDTVGKTVGGIPDAPDISLNGRLSSTTFNIFQPLTNGTSITKTLEVKLNTGVYMISEISPSNVRVRGTVKQLGTWSSAWTVTNAFTRTSVAAA